MYVQIEDGYLKALTEITPLNLDDAWLIVPYQTIDRKYLGAYRHVDGVFALDDAKKAAIDKLISAQVNTPQALTTQEQIEALQAENKELKEYVELISDSVVDLALRTLKEV